ncbi:MAG: peptide chain release factor N(5)-glutamine methyltransferase [Bacteroidaceae bacterium]|nr:peptide chain release factor N(5)-glutamine methyltransferase [Bacteroidaceae bacterium]
MNALQMLRERYAEGEARALFELIMQRRFGLSRTDLLLGKDTTLSANDKAELEIIVGRVAKGEPVQYVLGCEEFCGRTFLVGPGVLIPRPETQQLVALVRQNVPAGSTVLDVGTGSGCIAITLALDGYRVSATDVSDEALRIARRNAERLGAEVEFVKEDVRAPSPLPLWGSASEAAKAAALWHSPKGGAGMGLHAIVSNPPYVCRSETREMDDNVLLYEPHLALFVPDDDPLLFYRAIADYGLRHLSDDGWLFFEANRLYCNQVGELLRRQGYEDVEVSKDQFDNDRFVMGRRRKM